jgi:nitroreductase/NAD-dependent dihydropyrimidine dehydrogenase PreA subunit
MRERPATEIDANKCDGCGLCVDVCPTDTLSVINRKAVVTGDDSLLCDQCAAVCPHGAVRVRGIEDVVLATVAEGSNADALVRLMRSRRSCRMYKEDPVDKAVLEDLVKIGITAPSGTNSQLWTFTIVPDRASMVRLAETIADFFRRLNRMAESPVKRLVARVFAGDALGDYYRTEYETVKEALVEWEKTGRDQLFHGATAGIVVGMRPGASCPVEDALLATQNIVLAAEALGLGTCLIGYAVEAIKHGPGIKRVLGIPDEEKVHAVIAIGHPNVEYARPAGRKRPLVRYFSAGGA